VLGQTHQKFQDDAGFDCFGEISAKGTGGEDLLLTTEPAIERNPDGQHEEEADDATLGEEMKIGIVCVGIIVDDRAGGGEVEDVRNASVSLQFVVKTCETGADDGALDEIIEGALVVEETQDDVGIFEIGDFLSPVGDGGLMEKEIEERHEDRSGVFEGSGESGAITEEGEQERGEEGDIRSARLRESHTRKVCGKPKGRKRKKGWILVANEERERDESGDRVNGPGGVVGAE